MLVIDVKINDKEIDSLMIQFTGETSTHSGKVWGLYRIVEPIGGYWNKVVLQHDYYDGSYLDLLELAMSCLKKFGYYETARKQWKFDRKEQEKKRMREMIKLHANELANRLAERQQKNEN